MASERGLLNWPCSDPLDPHDLMYLPYFVEFRDAGVAESVGDKDVALRIPGDIGGSVEQIAGCARSGKRRGASSSARTASSTGPRPHHRPSAAACANENRFRLAAQRHQHASVRRELDHQARQFIDHPDVVLRIDAHRFRHQESVRILADLAEVFAGWIELEQARAAVGEGARAPGGRVGVAGARVDVNVAFRIGRDAGRFAHIHAIRHFQKVRRGIEGDFGSLRAQ